MRALPAPAANNMPVLMPTLPLPARVLACALTLAAAAAPAASPHEHGVARLDVTVDPSRVTVELDAPLDSLLGFERAPRSDAERAQLAAMIARLRDGGDLFRIDGAGGCTLDKTALVAPVLDLGQPPPAAPPAPREGHADLQARFEFSCKSAGRAGFVELGLFQTFAALRRIELQVLTPKGQLKATLHRPASRAVLPR